MSNISINNVSGSGNYFGDGGRVENHIPAAAEDAAPEPFSPAQVLALLKTLAMSIAENAASLPDATRLAADVDLARREIEAGPGGGRRRLPSARALLAGVAGAAAGVTAVTETIEHIVKLIGLMEADL